MTVPIVPYYEDDQSTIYHGNCVEILPRINQVVDLIVTDPPYGQAYNSNRGSHGDMQGDDGSVDVSAAIALACRLLRRGRHAYVFGPELLLPEVLTARCELIWNKQIVGMGDLSLPWSESHERITFAVHEISKVNRAKGYGRLAARLRQGSVISVQRTQSVAGLRHPTEKPVLLLRQLIESSSVIGETVLDPFMGVGSTLVAATLEARKSVGIEVDERYCEAAATRLNCKEV